MPSYITIHGPFTVRSDPPLLCPSFVWCLGPVEYTKESGMPVETILTTDLGVPLGQPELKPTS